MNPKVMHACYYFITIKSAPNEGQLGPGPFELNHLKPINTMINKIMMCIKYVSI